MAERRETLSRRSGGTCIALEALTEGEKTKIAEIRNEYRPKIVPALEGLRGTLTPEQAKVREDALKSGKSRRELIASLQLTDDQLEIQELLRHKSIRTTVRYTHVGYEQTRPDCRGAESGFGVKKLQVGRP